MLNENAIDKLLQPIITRQESINTWVIERIARRVREVGELKPTDVKQLIKLRDVGADVRIMNEEIAKLTNLQVADIKAMIKAVALDNYLDAKPFYDYRHKSFIPFEKNELLQRRIASIEYQTIGTYKNMSKAQGFMIRDRKNPKRLVMTPLAKAYQSIIDEAIQATQSGVIDYNTAMRRTIRQLGESGLRYVTYEAESGRKITQRMDSAVRRNLLDGVRAINQGMQDIVGQQFGADGVEISVHMNPAEDHQFMQGHQYSNREFANMQSGKDFRDVQGRKYAGFDRAVGTLNCRHFAISIIIGYAKQNYSDEQLADILRRNEEGYTLPNGKHLTMYDCTQRQHQIELKIRYAKDGQIAARAAGDIGLAKMYQAKINKYTSEYKAFSKACGLSMKTQKATVSGYRKISVN